MRNRRPDPVVAGRRRPVADRHQMTLFFHDTLTRRKVPFAPLDPAHVRLYACGPTVYDHAHIGNARPVVVFDVLYRLLRHHYPRVTYVRNITDIDDKINARAAESGQDIRELTETTTLDFHAGHGRDRRPAARPGTEGDRARGRDDFHDRNPG